MKLMKIRVRHFFMKNTTPRAAQTGSSFLPVVLPPALKKYIEGDLLELYDERLKTAGKRTAEHQVHYRRAPASQAKHYPAGKRHSICKPICYVQKLLPRSAGEPFKNKGFLSSTSAASPPECRRILIGLWVYDELSYDTNFAH